MMVEVQVMAGHQHGTEHFTAAIEVVQVPTTKVLTGVASAALIDG